MQPVSFSDTPFSTQRLVFASSKSVSVLATMFSISQCISLYSGTLHSFFLSFLYSQYGLTKAETYSMPFLLVKNMNSLRLEMWLAS